jgi:membrane associated rhomboid family serine protease
MGSLRFAGFYLLCGVLAAAVQMAVGPHSRIPMVGASGAISGVLAAYGSLYPRAPISVLNPVTLLWFFWGLLIELPAWLVILEYFVVNLLSALGSVNHRGGGVAFFAHLGGFVAGMLLVRLFMRGRVAEGYGAWHGLREPPRDEEKRRPPREVRRRDHDPWGW